MHVSVIGGGVFGVTAARELAIRGHQVVLHDPGPPHPLAASTDISKVIRADYGADDVLTQLGLKALAGWRAWNRDVFPRPLFHEDGFLLLTREAMAPGSFEYDSFARQQGLRRAGSWLRDSHPAWAHDRYPDGYYNPAGGWAESGQVVAALWADAQALGVQWECRQLPLEAIPGQKVVAAGAWTHRLLPELADRLRSIGQPVLHFRPADAPRWSAPGFVTWAADISKTGWYGFAANADGLVKVANHGVGVPADPDGARPLVEDTEATFRAFLRQSLPGLADAPCVGSRLCLYSDSFDGDFFIDRVPGRPDTVVASGGSGHGFKFAPILGPLIADVVEGRAPHPRFAWRARGTHRTEHARNA